MKSVYLTGCSIVLWSGMAVGAHAETEANPSVMVESDSVQQIAPIAQREIEVAVSSGIVVASSKQIASVAEVHRPQQVVVWAEVIDIPDAGWVRLQFGETQLAQATDDSRESYLRITSLYDGYEQYLDASAMRMWRGTSAYFNGGTVRVELMASPTVDAGMNEVEILSVMASEPTQFDRSLCGIDDRVFSTDPREARVMPIGCTAWLFGNQGNSMLSAGHCDIGNGGDVIQFNVPLSTAGGTPVNPSPQDQYVVDLASVQDTGGATTLGNDYAFFGVFDNTQTGLSPLQAQGASYELATSLPPLDGRGIRITGYGVTSSPMSPTLNQAQKTHVGPLFEYVGNVVRYTTDTTGGNSGGSVFDEVNQNVIAIHTNAGCESVGGNQGCSILNPGLQTALANPQGVTLPRGLSIGVQTFVPDPLSPAGGQTIFVMVTADNGLTPSGDVMMFVDTGSGFVGTPMTDLGDDTYQGVFPAADCPSTIEYYFEATDTEGGTWAFPFGGANGAISGFVAVDKVIAVSDSFESDLGWTVADTSLSTGSWDRGIPGDFGRSDPVTDFDGSGQCFVTGNTASEDVDGGPTVLTSPVFDLSGVEDPIVEYARWFMTEDNDDFLTVEFSDDGGASWTLVETVGDPLGWVEVSILISNHVTVTDQFMVRFSVSDNPNNSITEAAVDAFSISTIVCDTPCDADLTNDGLLDASDVFAFLRLYNAQDPVVDFVADGVVDIADVFAYLKLYNAGCP